MKQKKKKKSLYSSLIAYMFILWRQKQNANLTAKSLELEIENWIQVKTNTNINFKSDQALEFLRRLGNFH